MNTKHLLFYLTFLLCLNTNYSQKWNKVTLDSEGNANYFSEIYSSLELNIYQKSNELPDPSEDPDFYYSPRKIKPQIKYFIAILTISIIVFLFILYRSFNSEINEHPIKSQKKEVEKKEESSKNKKNESKHKENIERENYTKKESQKGERKERYTPKESTERSERVNSDEINWNANGSGVIISKDGYIATNAHVVKADENLKAKTIGVEFNYKDEITTFNAKIIKIDLVNDLAIIKIDDKKFTNLSNIPFSINDKEADLGEEVFALGYPYALDSEDNPKMGKDIKFTDGRISSKTGYAGNVTTYQSTTPIQKGNSGGPLFDYEGNLIGINVSGIKRAEVDNVSYTIKSSYLKTLINVLPKKINLPKKNNLSKLKTTDKIKRLTKYVVLIKIEFELKNSSGSKKNSSWF